MAIEDKHQDILYTMESVFITIYRDNPHIKDANVMRAVQALVALYRSKVMNREAPEPVLDETEMDMYNGVINNMSLRKELGAIEFEDAPAKKRFSRVLKKQTPDEIYLACLRRIEKSIKRWTSRNGIRGYLDFVKNFV